MIGRATGIGLAATMLVASSTACTSAAEEGSSPRFAATVATLTPEDGSVRGDIAISGSTAVVRDSFEDKPELTGFDIETGAQAWSVPAVSTEPVWVGGGFVAFHRSELTVEIRDLETGKPRHEIELNRENASGDTSALVGVSNSTVFVVNAEAEGRQTLSALDAKSGDELWEYEPKERGAFSSFDAVGAGFGVSIGDGGDSSAYLRLAPTSPVFAVADTGSVGTVTALDVESGDARWSVDLGGNKVPRMDWSGDGIVSAVTHASASSFEYEITAVDVESGARREIEAWHSVFDVEKRTWRQPGEEDAGVLAAEGYVFAQSGDRQPRVIDLRSGKMMWTADRAGEPLVLGEGVAVYRSVSEKGYGEVYGVDVESGKVLWKNGDVKPRPKSVIAEGKLLVRENELTEVFDLRTGEGLWRFRGELLGWNEEHCLFARRSGDGTDVEVTEQGGG